MTRASKLFAKLSEKEKSKEFEFWVATEDVKEALKVMLKVGLAKGDMEDSQQKISGMKVWTITSTEHVLQNLQHELAQKDINSWLEGERNESSGGIKDSTVLTWEELNTAFGVLPVQQIFSVMKGLRVLLNTPIQNKTKFTWKQLNSVLDKQGWGTLRIVDLIGKLI